MIVFWIIGVSFLMVGLLVSVPAYLKISACKEHAMGKILHVDSTGKNARAQYEYWVDGKRYESRTNWTSNYVFHTGGECYVRYDAKRPEYSYIKKRGLHMYSTIGTIFAVIGLGVLLMGIFLQGTL